MSRQRVKDYVNDATDGKGIVYQMEHAGFKAKLMEATLLQDNGRKHGLPPGEPLPVIPLACLPKAPSSWVNSAGSYVCPVNTNCGLWFDWTGNESLNTAVLASVKGMNPVTGQKIDDLTLEQYADKCPLHDCELTHGRFCQECGYELPPQNYICAPNTLWWDGFRQPDGLVRQFFFTEDEKKDIASLVIGKENTVPAFGFAFWKPKNPRTPPKREYRSKVMGYTKSANIPMKGAGGSWVSNSSPHLIHTQSISNTAETLYTSTTSSFTRGISTHVENKEVSVGAGAKIQQDLATDSLGLEGWQDKPSGLIRLYFCFEEQFREIVKGGLIDLEEIKNNDGFLKGLPVGG